MADPLPEPKILIADKEYDSETRHNTLAAKKIHSVIPAPKS